jgi:hypothetical protein
MLFSEYFPSQSLWYKLLYKKVIVFYYLATALDCISHSQIPSLHILLEMYSKYSDKQLYLLYLL